jgi:uncharacterized protein (DUF2236 family)
MPTPILPPAADWPSLTPHPGTITWRRAGDARVLIAAGYALLLQVAHPTVGAGVSEHSEFQRDPWGRLLRTLAEGIVAAHERFGRPFTAAQREQLWAEWRALGRLLGIRERDLPGDWRGFRGYVEAMVDRELEHTQAVDEVLAALARPAPPALSAVYRPMWPLARPQLGHLLRVSTIGLLPVALRRRFGLGWTHADELELRAIGSTLRAATPLMPASLRNTGPGYLCWRQRQIESNAWPALG